MPSAHSHASSGAELAATIRVRLLLLASVAEAAGHAHGDEVELTLPARATVCAIWAALSEQHPAVHAAAQRFRGTAAMALNERLVSPETVLSHDDVLALLPPVSGG